MAFDRFLIAPINTGWETDLKPWLIPDDAFEQLNNMYVFRGRLRKRFGSTYMGVNGSLSSRFSIQVGTTSGSGALSGTVPGAIFGIGQMFSIGSEIFTVSSTGTPAVMLDTGASTTHTYNTTTGAFVFTGAAINTPVFFYPAQPAMGLTVLNNGPINQQPSYGFDTQFVYTFDQSSARWQWSNTDGLPVFTGSNSQFFWSENFTSTVDSLPALFVSNFKYNLVTPADADHIWALEVGTDGSTTWEDFSVKTVFAVDSDDLESFVQTARVIIGWKNRLLLLNTVEQEVGGSTARHYKSRLRYSAIGSPFEGDSWLGPNNVSGAFTWRGASFIDASTEEEIVGAEFIKDRLIVFFETSTWEVTNNGNDNYPFGWNKLNTELGSESTFSTVPFDKVVLAIGSSGIHACNGSNVERIDNKIPDKIFNFLDPATSVARIWGIRDYFAETVYWCIPTNSQTSIQPFPSQVLVYNYKNNSWAVNDDTITCFGYFQQQIAQTLANWNTPLYESHWRLDGGDFQQNVNQIIAGNQEGFVYLVDTDVSRNCNSRQITNIVISAGGTLATFTIVDHMFTIISFVSPELIQGITGLNDKIWPIHSVPNANTFTIVNDTDPLIPFVGTYRGGGTIGVVSNPVTISKQWNPYVTQDRNVYIHKIDFAVQATNSGEITVDYQVGSSARYVLGSAINTNTILGTNVLETFPYPNLANPSLPSPEEEREKLWHPIYLQGDGNCVQITLSLSAAQIRNSLIAYEDLQIEGMALYTMATSSRLQ